MKIRSLRPRSRRYRFAALDRRTHEAKEFAKFKAELIAHVGGSPSATQLAMIERCAWLNLRLRLLDRKLADGEFTEGDSAAYLAWSNALSRALVRLGLQTAPKPRPTVFDYLRTTGAPA